MNIFVSYSHSDSFWLDRLIIHLSQKVYEVEIDSWSDRRLQIGTRWREEIGSALERADIAILLISADFLASKFIREHELPPLLVKAVERKDFALLPIIVSPSLFSLTPELSGYQAANDPKNPLICLSKGEQEKVFSNVAEHIYKIASLSLRSSGGKILRSEDFCSSQDWPSLVKLGAWTLDGVGVKGKGEGAFLLSRYEYGDTNFKIDARIKFSNFEKPTTNPLIGMNAGIVFGWLTGYFNILLTGSGVLLERSGRPGVGSRSGYLTNLAELNISPNIPVTFELKFKKSHIILQINGKPVFELNDIDDFVGRVGVRAWRSEVLIESFIVQEVGE